MGLQVIGGLVLISGLYNILALPHGPNRAYYGDDPARWQEANVLPDVVRCGVPSVIAVAEHDPEDFVAQARDLAAACQRPSTLLQLAFHNHVSIVQHIGAVESDLTRKILALTQTARPRL
jgi:triacylglycerol lipase